MSHNVPPPNAPDISAALNRAESRINELTRRLIATEAQLRAMTKVAHERATLLESQLAVAESRAINAEHNLRQVESELDRAVSSPQLAGGRPLSRPS